MRLPRLAPLLLIGATACSSFHPAETGSSIGDSDRAGITRETAAMRSRWIARPLVALWVSLDAKSEAFEGRETLQFRIRSRDELKGEHFEAPRLDFVGGKVRSLVINGRTIPGDDIARRTADGHTIELRSAELEIGGMNRIEITYSHPYSNSGYGLTRYKDPQDGESYVYTNLEPHHAREVLPIFDQPDLKAAFELTVEAPEKWTVIANTPERQADTARGRRTWEFPPSPQISPYVFALLAGPWAKWTKESSEGLELGLFARKSLQKEFNPETVAWFQASDAALKFFAEKFGHPYPYAKLDQILVPEFPAGGMENVAAITYTEGLLLRTKATRARQLHRAETIFHEIAHMWFGNLVTPRWWNGLWLNESFATFASYWGLEGSGLFPEAWGLFFDHTKSWAYFEDELVTSHPIETSTPDTNHALASFDGITYGKGAAVLKQLAFRIGDDDFTEGLHRYFRRHALRNTTLADFMTVMSEVSGENLTVWQRDWMQTTGFNTLQAKVRCEDDPKLGSVLTNLEITQEPAAQARSHQIQVGIFGPGRAVQKKGRKRIASSPESLVLPVRLSSESASVKTPDGTPCPDFVMPNYEDHDYVAVRFDEHSLDTAEKSLSKFEDALMRRMIWHSLWQMVLHAELSPERYLVLAEKQLPSETDETIVSGVLSHLAQTRMGSSSIVRFVSDADRASIAARAEKLACALFEAQKPESSARLALWENCLQATRSAAGVERVANWLKSRKPPRGIPWDVEQRWKMAAVLARTGAAGAESAVASIEKDDPSDRGRKRAQQLRAEIPNPETKKKLLEQLLPEGTAAEPSLSLEARREVAMGLMIAGQESLLEPLVAERYFDALPALVKQSDPEHATRMASILFPAFCRTDLADKARGLASARSDEFPEPVLEVLRAQAQLEDRCARIRAARLK